MIKLTSEQLADRAARYLLADEGFKQAIYLDRKDTALESIRVIVRQAIDDAASNEKARILKIVSEVHPADGVEGCGCGAEIEKRIQRKPGKPKKGSSC